MIKTITSQISQDFISLHENDNPAELALKYSNKKRLDIHRLVSQIKSRQKAKLKLPEWFQTEKVIFPHGVSMEQCSSEVTAKFKAELIKGNSLIDLTGGTGIDTFYLSKGFEKTTYVEQNSELCELAQHNFSSLKSNTEIVNSDAESFLKNTSNNFDWVFIDPARRSESNKKVFKIEDCQPNIVHLLPFIFNKSTHVLVKFSPMLDIKEALKTIPNIKELFIVSVKNECKEILLLIENGFEASPMIKAVNLLNEYTDIFSFSYQEEMESIPTFSHPNNYLYEPNASILKAGAFNKTAIKFKLSKLHANSHLYTSEKKIEGFQGRIFKIKSVISVSQKELKRHLENGKANLTIRNFPLTTQQLRKKLKIKDGGNVYVFATTLFDGKHKLVICEKTESR